MRALLALADDETLLVQSGKPVGVFTTHAGAPRVLIANSLLVPRWATWDEFRRLEALGLTMFGQMTAGSWIYIGTQGILQGTYQTFAAAGERHFGSPELAGRTILTAGLGGMGGAQPLAATMAGAAILCVEVDPARIERRLATRYLDEATESLDDALARVRGAAARAARRCRSGCSGTQRTSCPSSRAAESTSISSPTRRRHTIRSRATSPPGSRSQRRPQLRSSDPDEYLGARACRSRPMSRASSSTSEHGSYVFDYGNNLRGEAHEAGVEEAFTYPGFVPAYIRPLFCRGIGPFRWAALSGDPADIAVDRRRLRELFPDDALLQRWLELAPERVAFQGLPARICWLGLGDRAQAGLAINELVRSGSVSRAGRDRPRPPRLRLGRLAVPRDGGDARRLRRDRRLADPQRARERRRGRDVGQRPPRRRGRHRQLDPRRHGRRRRRHRRGGASASSAC